ncbi:MAG: HlyD family efflux transporter periplasmic adaptor subunit [Prochloraceae cyanobacterium]|nr:HlyD family efflux transporter periplasmic adaptor subunit [Prochloraceae cyanobacterium]
MKKFISGQKNNPSFAHNKRDLIPDPKKKLFPKRAIIAGAFVSAGIAAVAIGANSIGYRVTHLILEEGLVTGRLVRVRSPIDGNLSAVYVKPGIKVKTGEVLARVEQSHEDKQSLVDLEAEIRSKKNQLDFAKENQVLQTRHLQSLEKQHARLWGVKNRVLNDRVAKKQAALEEARHVAKGYKREYQNYKDLHDRGAISRNRVEQSYSNWKAASAKIDRAQVDLRGAKADLNTSKNNLAAIDYGNWQKNTLREIQQLRKEVEAQSILVKTLEREVTIAQERLNHAKSRYSDRQDLEIAASFRGVIYETLREKDELVKKSEPIVTVLDCQQIWVEIVTSTEEAQSIDRQKPAIVQLVGSAEKLPGEIESIKPINNHKVAEKSEKSRVQAVSAAIPEQLQGESLSLITVSIPPPSSHSQAYKFCGVGQNAKITLAKNHL